MKEIEEFYEKIANDLTNDEYQFIKKNLDNKDCHTCMNESCKVESYEKPVDDCFGWENKRIIGKSKVLEKRNIYELK